MSNEFKGRWVAEQGDLFFKTCEELVNNERSFNSFKTHPIFCGFIGNDTRTKEQATKFLANINKELLNSINKYKTNDILGSPPLHYFEETGYISSGTLYFLSILSRIINTIGDIKNKKICEIGSGYGGQAKIILDYGVESYTCIDHEYPLKLATKYLSTFNYSNITYVNNKNVEEYSYDLVISNWCLSELDIEGIDFYLKNVISKSKNGYFEMNMESRVTKDWLLSKLNKIFIDVIEIPEVVSTGGPVNFLLICKNNKYLKEK
jgi:hypothetical protein